MHGCIMVMDACMTLEWWTNRSWMDAWTVEVCIYGGWMDNAWIDRQMNACLVDVCIMDGYVDNRCNVC